VLIENGTKADAPCERQAWLGALARADADRLHRLLADAQQAGIDTEHLMIRPPEIGSVLVTARIGGSGARFAMGEMTITRCAVSLADRIGIGYVTGRRKQHARNVAVCDALLQGMHSVDVAARVIEPLVQERARRDANRRHDTETSRVQFLTMVRSQ
jgi:alpha-D-ribose 1-methylphosphonate 5-triphosphate synthase subunit PhnG